MVFIHSQILNIVMTFTSVQLAKIFPSIPKDNQVNLASALDSAMNKYSINTIDRKSPFIAQVAHESANFSTLTENLNYSAKGLRATWPSRFPSDAIANAYAHNASKIAEKVYGGRMGNGPEGSGDGFKYRGAGFIMCTGKAMFEAASKEFNKSLDDTVTYLHTTEGAAMSAAWFWNKNGLNELADKKQFTDITKKINGGVIGLAERQALYIHVLAILS